MICAGVVGVVGADVRAMKRRAHSSSLASSADSDGFFPGSHHVVEIFYHLRPILRVKRLERLVVVAAEFFGRLAVELREALAIPENQVRGELADGVVFFPCSL